MERFMEGLAVRKCVLAGVSLSLYWASALIAAGVSAYSVQRGELHEPIACFAGITLTLVLMGVLPRAATSRAFTRAVRVVAVVAPLVSCALAVFEQTLVPVPVALVVVSRFLLGVTLGCILSQTGAFLAGCAHFTAAVVVTVSFFAGALVYVAVAGVQTNLFTGVLLTLGSGVTFSLAGFGEREADPFGGEGAGAARAGGEGARTPEATSRPLRLPQGFWALSGSLFLYSVVYGISIALTLAVGGGFAHNTPIALVLLIPGVIFFSLLVRFRDGFDFRRFQWLLFVPGALALLPLPFASRPVALACCGLLILVFTFYDLASFALLVDLARHRAPALALRVFSWGRAANVVGMMGGWALSSVFLGSTLQTTGGLVATAYSAVAIMVVLTSFFGSASLGIGPVALVSVQGEQGVSQAPVQGAAAAPPVETLDTRCDAVAAAYGLSAREAEVFKLLAHGRSTAHIADALCISTSTVKTHAYRIYRKLDVHSQQDIIDLAEQAP